MIWRKLEPHEQGMWCATEGCWGIPTVYMEAGGIGSKYCSVCRGKIEAHQQAWMKAGGKDVFVGTD